MARFGPSLSIAVRSQLERQFHSRLCPHRSVAQCFSDCCTSHNTILFYPAAAAIFPTIIGLFANWVEGSGWVLGQKALSQTKSHSLYCTLPHSTTLPHAPNTLTTHFKLSLSPHSLTPLPSQSALSIFSICLGSWLRV